MRIIRFGIGLSTCVVLNACTQLLTALQVPEGCYPVDTLSASQQTALHVGDGNPILLVGDERFVCPCYRGSSFVGAEEKSRLTGAEERGHLVGDSEKKGDLLGDSEDKHLRGDSEKKRDLLGAGEQEHLVGDSARLRLSCRIVPECPGFQLIGYESQQDALLGNFY